MKRRGFTLIELLVVISVIALLSSVVLASLNTAREKGRIAGARQFAAQVDHLAGEQAIGIWDFDECTGTTANDRSGFGHHGVLTNMATTSWSTDTPDGRGCSLIFDGTNDYIDMGSQATLDVTGSYTISVWFVKNVVSGYLGLVGRHDNYGYNLALDGTGNTLRLDMMKSVSYDSFSSSKFITNGFWHQAVAVYDATAQKVFYYYDGAQTDSFGATNAYILNPAAGAASSFIVGWEGYAGRYWNGKIDAVRIFSKALTASEVGALYASEKAGDSMATR